MGAASVEETDFNNTLTPIFSPSIPTAHAASGIISGLEFELLHHYKAFAWRTLTVRDDLAVASLYTNSMPQLSISNSYLLYAILSIAASHSNMLVPCKRIENQALLYRQRTFSEYSRALQNITTENYEPVLITSILLLSLVPPPESDAQNDDVYLVWMDTFLKMSEGLRILASLRWAAGIEKLSAYPLICRELRTLPPPPVIYTANYRHLRTRVGEMGTTPDHPNPPSTYCLRHSEGSLVFLPPPLMHLLISLSNAESGSGPIDLHGNTLYPALHAMSPIFLSLYYYHLNPDFFVRVFVFCSFLMPEFLLLVKNREPRALVIIAWWFALAGMAPRGWWTGRPVEKVMEAVGKIVMKSGDEVTQKAFESVERLICVLKCQGSTAAAKSIFDEWIGITWNEGPRKAEEWEAGLLTERSRDLDFNIPV